MAAYDDLRGFLDTLDKEGQLLRITDEVMPEPDIAAAANAAPRLGDAAPALYFDNVTGFTDARIAMNVHGSWANHALALGLPKGTSIREQVEEFIRRWERFSVAPEWRDAPPWAQNTVAGDDVNVFDVLPLIRLNDGDGGFYIDKAAVVSKDPDDPENSGKQNVGVYRIEVKGRRRLALQPVPMHDLAQHLRKAEEKGEDLPLAITLGNDPVISIVASTPMEYDQNEYELAGALRGAPAPVTKAPVTGLPVPWGSEVVIEGVIKGRKREIECGPRPARRRGLPRCQHLHRRAGQGGRHRPRNGRPAASARPTGRPAAAPGAPMALPPARHPPRPGARHPGRVTGRWRLGQASSSRSGIASRCRSSASSRSDHIRR
ncbi:UbiD family decarboxylase domain-containing protein [Actinomadura sp. NPDC047616]|uniref:UbiD family decarboxylase domain-containing protein n=1 Tax=Actinomadura sp. NPDC047616 TaxID=3155914 RepID=UPI0034071933